MAIAKIETDQVGVGALRAAALVLAGGQVAGTLQRRNRPTTLALVWGTRSVDIEPLIL